ncbi:MAG TPA: glycerol-3-phosphate 1-O-acyltransferase PlsY [Chthoniobacteraceae bacterium]|nr:glycerol-3-phosphate 1-O-acyltransferase PlsY [Chthoniobacteraceae bacterium]
MYDLLPLSALAGYLLGSIPFGFLVARMRGIDIRQHGSGNIGATNVLRVVGRKWGFLVFALDALKGFLAVYGTMLLVSTAPAALIAAALGCILGHNFPVWLRFKGGKGIATTAGALIGLFPLAIGVAFLVWVALFYATRYVSLASIGAAAVLPPVVWWQAGSFNAFVGFSFLIAALAIWRHRSNIRRLLDGTENRFERKKT